jgi:hypothetical protein
MSPGSPFNKSLWFSLVSLPIGLGIVLGFWRKYLIPSLRRS